MATLGEFRPISGAVDAKRVFLVTNSRLEVDDSSVSSDWTTESEGETVQPSSGFAGVQTRPHHQSKRKRIRTWRVKHDLSKHQHLRDAASSSSSSDTSSNDSSSTSSSSESRSDASQRSGGQERRSRNDRRVTSTCNEVHIKHIRHEQSSVSLKMPLVETPKLGGPCRFGSSPTLHWSRGSKKYRQLAFALGFLSASDILALGHAAAHPTVKEINDRKAYLAFKHRVVRFEMQLRALYPELYSRLLALMRLADAEVWKALRKKRDVVYPEIEYIEYDVSREGGECYIEPHVDNKSGVTLVAMLTPSSDYTGGRSCFRRAEGTEGHRQAGLELGDVVLFRGEKLLHWITNVTGGRRVVLQIELSRV